MFRSPTSGSERGAGAGADMSDFLTQRCNLPGKVAVVLGGAGGIGRAVTLALGSAGVDVGFCDTDPEAMAATLAELRALGRTGFARVLDVTRAAALEEFYAEVAASFERLDIVVNVVGGVRHPMRWCFWPRIYPG